MRATVRERESVEKREREEKRREERERIGEEGVDVKRETPFSILRCLKQQETSRTDETHCRYRKAARKMRHLCDAMDAENKYDHRYKLEAILKTKTARKPASSCQLCKEQ